MEVTIRGTPEEIAALVLAAQERRVAVYEEYDPLECVKKAVQKAIDGIAEASQDSS